MTVATMTTESPSVPSSAEDITNRDDTEYPDRDDTEYVDETEHGLNAYADELDSSARSGGTEEAEVAKKIDHEETRMVNRSKWVVYLVIVLSAAVAGTLTYLFVKDEEKRWYEDEFQDLSTDIFDYTEVNLQKLQESSHAVGESWTSFGTYEENSERPLNATLGPNITFPNFGLVVGNLAALSKAEILFVAPLVEDIDLVRWESYAVEHQSWIEKDWEVLVLNFEADSDESEEGDDESGESEEEESEEEESDDEEESGEGKGEFVIAPGRIRENVFGRRSQGGRWALPIWQTFPPPMDAYNSPIMMDLMGLEWFRELFKQVRQTKKFAISPVTDINFLIEYQESDSSDDPQWIEPKSVMVHPILDNLDPSTASVAGVVVAIIEWTDYIDEDLGDMADGMILDLEYVCPGSPTKRYSFDKEGIDNYYLGEDYVHDPKYDDIAQRQIIVGEKQDEDSDESDESGSGSESESDDSEDRRVLSSSDDEGGCAYYMSVHATDKFVENHATNDAVVYTVIVCSIFILTGLVFLMYDFLVQMRNKKVVSTAERSNAIVTSLFPKNVAEKLMEEEKPKDPNSPFKRNKQNVTAQALQAMGAPDLGVMPEMSKAPIADLFTDTTILFADIAGFTAWSSMREPTQVFHLLESIFNAFDVIADRRKIFKVETVGDCYVAVCGLPKPNVDHAVAMARFAWESMLEMNKIMTRLESELGPDTSALNMRYGMHSGPVTAGVLRGQKARFQLFGDSMNKASRIETSGKAGRVHMSAETADLLIARGKGHWVTKREDKVNLKGLGELSTYWLFIQSEGSVKTNSSILSFGSNTTATDSSGTSVNIPRPKKTNHQVSWHTKVLAVQLRKLVALRRQQSSTPGFEEEEALKAAEAQANFGKATPNGCISFPVIEEEVDANSVVLGNEVMKQLTAFVDEIAYSYNANYFHNFEHASHMVMSVTKLLSHMESSCNTLDDPMTQFVAVLTALIHDVDHPGISNQQLALEGHRLSALYGSSIAERNSLDVAWKLLRKGRYHALRRTIYRTVDEFEFFRELVVHALLATDVMDKEQQRERHQRWTDAFGNDADGKEQRQADFINKQKTAVLEHVIQASDVAHTMQHWKVYQQWNCCLFYELSNAHQAGRMEKNPAAFWYEGEMKFFDFCIIPLARRLKECESFRTSGEELLQYALSNRKEWEEKGERIVKTFQQNFQKATSKRNVEEE